nr:MAG TPA: hypothetical protein [Caudoviricetes sp.]DAP75365.1 MAG TPA: hypothetical protein [Caudoviricetes sp.]
MSPLVCHRLSVDYILRLNFLNNYAIIYVSPKKNSQLAFASDFYYGRVMCSHFSTATGL